MPDLPVVITKTYDLILWMTPLTEKFPQGLRFTLADRIQNNLLDLLTQLIEAQYAPKKVELLRRANLGVDVMRHLIRLAKDLKSLSLGQYEHGSRLLDEVGRMIGGWTKAARA